ncbi:DUF397 domain-containing protein [Kineosporia babensis]|uniref:DUF397 domain-containing protein n=1 Tax=Kineosporia babensis TaxID=499548 RepID=A0A9X1NNW9_9ACTN|nr:DUF397 domain-containing protein [Kineosporia babensis]MCD5317219.1 DUF397 domain-containing protein [Kineosporia babensis]
MTAASPDPAVWLKAQRSQNSNGCIEQCRPDTQVSVRDTKQHGQGPTLRMSRSAYATWIASAKDGELDHLAGL